MKLGAYTRDMERNMDTNNDTNTAKMENGQVRLSGRSHIVAFITAGNSRFTFRSIKTGARFSYRVKEAKDKKGLWFVSVLNGPDNTADYAYIGTLSSFYGKTTFKHGHKSTISAEAPSVKAFEWAWLNLAVLPEVIAAEKLDLLEVFHEGRCGRCSRPLTVPESILSGLGPECAGRI